MPKIEMVGKKYGLLKVINDLPPHITPNNNSVRMVLCECECGKILHVQAQHLRSGNTLSCGCKSIELNNKHKITHGMSKTRIYRIWQHMKSRCSNDNNQAYSHYGGRGITVCTEWTGKNGFVNFYNWAMKNGYSDDLSIDRINVNGNYEPDNCRWANKEVQQNNKTNNVIISYNGESMNLSQWARKINIPVHVLICRKYLGWDDKKVLETPYHKYNKKNHA